MVQATEFARKLSNSGWNNLGTFSRKISSLQKNSHLRFFALNLFFYCLQFKLNFLKHWNANQFDEIIKYFCVPIIRKLPSRNIVLIKTIFNILTTKKHINVQNSHKNLYVTSNWQVLPLFLYLLNVFCLYAYIFLKVKENILSKDFYIDIIPWPIMRLRFAKINVLVVFHRK